MDWSPDFCLSCDRQIAQPGHGAYCSQSCRLADLEKASNSSGSPRSASSSSWASSSTAQNGFYLPPAVNFSAMSNRHSMSEVSPTSRSPFSSTPPNYSSSSSYHYSNRTSQLYTSPSRTSLSSLQSTTQQEPAVLSDKVKNELRDYASSFDHIRDWKRRMTVV